MMKITMIAALLASSSAFAADMPADGLPEQVTVPARVAAPVAARQIPMELKLVALHDCILDVIVMIGNRKLHLIGDTRNQSGVLLNQVTNEQMGQYARVGDDSTLLVEFSDNYAGQGGFITMVERTYDRAGYQPIGAPFQQTDGDLLISYGRDINTSGLSADVLADRWARLGNPVAFLESLAHRRGVTGGAPDSVTGISVDGPRVDATVVNGAVIGGIGGAYANGYAGAPVYNQSFGGPQQMGPVPNLCTLQGQQVYWYTANGRRLQGFPISNGVGWVTPQSIRPCH